MEYKSNKTVFESVMEFLSEVKSHKKKSIDKQRVLQFLEDLYSDKQTVQVNIGARPIKFEGLNEEQTEWFLKIFDGYKENFDRSSKLGKVERHEDFIVNNNGFEDITSASATQVINMIPTPPID